MKMKRRKSLAALAPVDRLSSLPEDILHHILSRLRTDEVIKTCVLSTKLMSLWPSIPVLDFEHSARSLSLAEMLLDGFLNRLCRIVQQRSQHAPVVLHKFRLCLVRYRRSHPDGRVDEAISSVIKNGVKELVLESVFGVYPLPDIAFAGSVTSLTLCNIKVNKLNQLLRGFPLLENLTLRYCIGPQHTKISGSKIKSLHFQGRDGLKSVDIDCPRLQFLTFGCPIFHLDHFSLDTSCRNFLKMLKLTNAPITDNWIENLLPSFALLEMLQLTYCDELKIIKVSKNSNLKQVWFELCQGLQDVDVRVTDLESFSFSGIPGDHHNGEIKWDRICNIDIIHCKHLRRLSLHGCGIPLELLREQVPKLLQLDRLELEDFHSFQDHRVVISHKYLKHLKLLNCRRILNTVKVIINTPRLVSFSYRASFDKINPFVSFVYNPTLSAALTICSKTPVTPLETSFFENLYGLVRLMDGCKVLTYGGDCKNLIFPRDLRVALASPSVCLKHFRVELPASKLTVELLDSVLWLAPNLRTLDFTSFHNNKIILSIKFEYDQWMTEEDNTVNPSDLAARQHYSSRKVDMEIHEEVEERVNLLKYFKDEVKSLSLINWR